MTMLEPRLFAMPQHGTTSDDYYTPAWVFERMGIEFDIDVCAPPGGVPWVPAKRSFDQADDGLSQPWDGRVWMNPPYSNTAPWAERFIAHGNGVALVQHCRSRWHVKLWASAHGMADPAFSTPSGSLFQFIKDGKSTSVYMPVVIAAFGEECVEAISRLGPVRVLA